MQFATRDGSGEIGNGCRGEHIAAAGENAGQRGDDGIARADRIDRFDDLNAAHRLHAGLVRHHDSMFAARDEHRLLRAVRQCSGESRDILFGNHRTVSFADERTRLSHVQLQNRAAIQSRILARVNDEAGSRMSGDDRIQSLNHRRRADAAGHLLIKNDDVASGCGLLERIDQPSQWHHRKID